MRVHEPYAKVAKTLTRHNAEHLKIVETAEHIKNAEAAPRTNVDYSTKCCVIE